MSNGLFINKIHFKKSNAFKESFKKSNAKWFDFFGWPLLKNAIPNHFCYVGVNCKQRFSYIGQDLWLGRVTVTVILD